MPRLPIGSAYQSASRIASAQRRVNLYVEKDQQQGPVQSTLYPRPGLTPLGGLPPVQGAGRCLYAATNGDLYAVVGQTLYFVDQNYVYTAIGSLITPAATPVYIADNGENALVVDGSTTGLNIDLATRTAIPIADPNFLGGNRITFLNFFLLINELNSPNFYSTAADSVIFNALFFGSMTQSAGNCNGLIASEAAVWIFNQYKGEVWADAGTSPFAFQPLSGIIVEHGLAGSYALGRQDVNIFWLSQSPEGGRVAMRGYSNAAQRISAHQVEREWLTYSTVADCVVTTFQMKGHLFVCYDFPTADRTWIYDTAQEEWYEWGYFDVNGVQHRWQALFKAYTYGINIAQDHSTGQLYKLDETNYSDNGLAQIYIEDFPHVVEGNFDELVTIWQFLADVQCGNGTGLPIPQIGSPWALGFSNGFGPQTLINPPMMTLYVSHDRGYNFFAHSDQIMAGPYGYNTRPTFNRIGISYDTVLRLQWSGPFETRMNAPFIVTETSMQHGGDE